MIAECLKVVAFIEILQETRRAFILGVQILCKPLTTQHILPDNVVPLLCMFNDVVQLFHTLKQQQINYLRVSNMRVLTDLGGDGRTELGFGDDVV